MKTQVATSPPNGSDHPQVIYEDRKLIVRSPFNRTIDTACQAYIDLVESVRTHGVIQPLIVRPYSLPKKATAKQLGKQFELIAGERRWLAAGSNGIPKVPIIVRSVTDTEAIELQTIENKDRADLSPIEKAEKFHQLLEQYHAGGLDKGQAMAQLCLRLNLGKATVYEALSLLKLPDPVKRSIQTGAIPASHAALITKLEKRPDLVTEAAKVILKSDDGAMSFRESKQLIDDLQEEAKNDAEYNRIRDEFTAKKLRILTPAENKKVFPYSNGYRERSHYVTADDDCNEDASYRKYSAMWGNNAPPKILARDTESGKPCVVYNRQAALKAVATKLKKRQTVTSSGRRGPSERARGAAHRQRMKVFLELLGKVASKAEKMDGPQLWRFVFEQVLKFGGHDSAHRVMKRRGYEPLKGYHDAKVIREALAKRPASESRGAAAELLFARFAPSNWSSGWDPGFADSCKLLGIPKPEWKQKIQASGKAKTKRKKK